MGTEGSPAHNVGRRERVTGAKPRGKLRRHSPVASIRATVVSELERRAAWYSVEDDLAPRPLLWEEARLDALPIGATVRAVVECLKPYGAFLGFICAGRAQDKRGKRIQGRGEDSFLRGFCATRDLGPFIKAAGGDVKAVVGCQVAVKILGADPRYPQRILVSAERAEPKAYLIPAKLAPSQLNARAREDSDAHLKQMSGEMRATVAGFAGLVGVPQRMPRDPEAEALVNEMWK